MRAALSCIFYRMLILAAPFAIANCGGGNTDAVTGPGVSSGPSGGTSGTSHSPGAVVYWTRDLRLVPITASKNGVEVGGIIQPSTDAPACFAPNNASFSVPTIGSLAIVLSNPNAGNWSYTLTPQSAPSGGCTQVEIVYSPATLTIQAAGTGSGTVTSVGGSINCVITHGNIATTGCSATRTDGTSFGLQASPANDGSAFVGWPVSCPGTIVGNSVTTGICVYTLHGSSTVSAQFTSPNSKVTIAPVPGASGSGTITSVPAGINCRPTSSGNTGACSSSFPAGTVVTLTEVPDAGSFFPAWNGPTGLPCNGLVAPAPCVFTMPQQDMVLQAYFARIATPPPPTAPPPSEGSGGFTSVCLNGATHTFGSAAYACFGNVKGVDFYWRNAVKLAYSNTYEVLFALMNTTNLTKDVMYTPTFRCSDGSTKLDQGEEVYLNPGQQWYGEILGNYFLPCADGYYATSASIVFQISP